MQADNRETWVPIGGWPGYSVSDGGRVRSESRAIRRNGNRAWIRGRILQQFSRRGCPSVTLYRDNFGRKRYVATLVREAFGELKHG